MAIVYDPKQMLKNVAPDSKIKRLVSRRLDFKRAAMAFIDNISFIDKKAVANVALKTLKSYRQRRDAEAAIKKADSQALEKELVQSPMQLIQRVQNEVIWQVSQEIKAQYRGEQYEWLPSDADEPDPEHQLNYGKIFTIGEGEMPGERIGCKCGMRILVKDSELKLT